MPCDALGATVETHVQNWHSMHARSFCELYGLQHSESCGSKGLRRARIFNSGVLVLSKAHLPLVEGWEKSELR